MQLGLASEAIIFGLDPPGHMPFAVPPGHEGIAERLSQRPEGDPGDLRARTGFEREAQMAGADLFDEAYVQVRQGKARLGVTHAKWSGLLQGFPEIEIHRCRMNNPVQPQGPGLIGGGLGFLWYNAPPAAVFMGDTGSLALGGALGAIAVATKHEIVLAIVGGLFVVEALSVIIQVLYFKRTGKRVFLMAPIHHHYEKKGWAEPTIVIRFWIIALILAMIGLATLKVR